MQHLLLLGAGFSHNWNGWLASEAFDYLLGAPSIVQSHRLRALLWSAKARGDGFEGALSDLQDVFQREPTDANRVELKTFEDAIVQMFDDMNRGFFGIQRFEFHNNAANRIGGFLTRFDAIFTLNQDLLLEHHYMGKDDYFYTQRHRWDGPALPGMTALRRRLEDDGIARWSGPTWQPIVPMAIDVPARAQPVYKLHGSSKWQTAQGDRLLVAGGNKVRTIRAVEILKLYHEEFERRLELADTRLMTIGYGFHDNHINQAIKKAGDLGSLGLYIVDTRGTDALLPAGAGPLAVGGGGGLIFQDFICGASRRPLSQTFGGDVIEHAKLMRFFDN